MKIEWSPRAERDVTQLRDYIAQDSPFYARQFTERLIQSVERLTSMPRSGRMVPEAGHQDTIREVIFQGYRIFYRIQDDQQRLQIVTIVHGNRDLAGMELPWQPPPSTP
ncbi:MAG: type II toxin-antitoxin system RelE/ParE family toxin [Gammaproteobacteria bacterium]|nr:type II toxin-antitoxin system RelE/ParE family toxin [Gammaproteobacteria bacterium]